MNEEQIILSLSLQLDSTKIFLDGCNNLDVPITKNLLKTRIFTLQQSLTQIEKCIKS